MEGVVLDGYSLNPGDLSWDSLASLASFSIYDRSTRAEALARSRGKEIIITNKCVIDKAFLDANPQVSYIGVLATGYNVVDTEEASRRGIVVTNVPSYGTHAVAQYVFALLLEAVSHVGLHASLVKDGEWGKSPDFCFWRAPLSELDGKVMGIIGYGRIGQNVEKIAATFGMRCLVYSPHARSEVSRNVSLDELYRQSDVISLHCPATERNRGFINSEAISQMKKGVIIINTARGSLVNENDIASALSDGHIATYASDVLDVEPQGPDNVIIKARGSIVTPHIAWAAMETRRRLLAIATDNLASFLKGETINRVN